MQPTTGVAIRGYNGTVCAAQQTISGTFYSASLINGCMNTGGTSVSLSCNSTGIASTVYLGAACNPSAVLANMSGTIPLACISSVDGGRVTSSNSVCYGGASTSPAASTTPTSSLSFGASPAHTPAASGATCGAAMTNSWVGAVAAATAVAAVSLRPARL